MREVRSDHQVEILSRTEDVCSRNTRKARNLLIFLFFRMFRVFRG